MKTTTTTVTIALLALAMIAGNEMNATNNLSASQTNNSISFNPYKKKKRQHTTFGVQGGVSLSGIGGDWGDETKTPPAFGIHLGVNTNIPLNQNVSLRMAFLFSQKGLKSVYESTNTTSSGTYFDTDEQKITLSYLEIPVLVSYNTESGFFIAGGPYMGLLVGCKYKWESLSKFTPTAGSEVISEDSGSDSSTEGINPIDFGLNITTGINLENGLGFSAGFAKGLSRISKTDYEGANKYTNNNFKFSMTYTFGN